MQLDVNNASEVKKFLQSCSKQPGIYQMYSSSDEILYIGKAKNLAKRLASYFNKNQKSSKVSSLVKQIAKIETTVTNTEAEALILECNLIKLHHPKYNILLRDDKSYPYICLSKHKYPRIYLYRGKKAPNAQCFGPYPNVVAARETIKLIEQVFLIRSCTDTYFNNRARPCLLYQIKRCSGPCVGNIDQIDYSNNFKNTKLFLNGKDQEVITQLVKQMEDCSLKLEYEKAGQIRDKIKKLQAVTAQQYIETKTLDKNLIQAIDVAAVRFIGDHIALVIMQYRKGSLVGSREFFSKARLDDNDEAIVSIFAQYYLNLNNSLPKELLINFADYTLSPASKKLLTKILDSVNICDNFYENSNTGLEVVGNSLLAPYAPRFMRGVQTPRNISGSRGQAAGSRGEELSCQQPLKASQVKKSYLIKNKWLDLVIKNLEELVLSKTNKDYKYNELFNNLKLAIGLEQHIEQINKIECFDISHTFGNQTMASCVVFTPEGPDKSQYRRYNINNASKANDIAAMQEVLLRRYKKIIDNNLEMPNLILIDGGKAQVNIAKQVFNNLNYDLLANKVYIYGITKGEGRRAANDRILDAVSMEFINPNSLRSSIILLQQIRDEAHRFAIMGHRAKRAKDQTHSKLEDIPGVGHVLRRRLLTHFGGWQELSKATVEQIASIPGISLTKAKLIHNFINN